MTAPVGTPVSDSAPADGADTVLAVEHVGVVFSGRSVLDDVSFEIRAGEFTGLIGSNGAGKTTLLRVILGLQRTGTGRVVMPGSPGSRRHRSVGYVPQKLVLDPDVPLRARDLVALGIDGNRFGLRLPSRRASVGRGGDARRCRRPSASPIPGSAPFPAASCSGS